MRWSLNHRLLRLIEGRWIAIREVLKGLGRMRNTRTESICEGNFLIKDAGDLSAWNQEKLTNSAVIRRVSEKR